MGFWCAATGHSANAVTFSLVQFIALPAFEQPLRVMTLARMIPHLLVFGFLP